MPTGSEAAPLSRFIRQGGGSRPLGVRRLKGASKGMVESMTEGELEGMASTSRKNLPRKKS